MTEQHTAPQPAAAPSPGERVMLAAPVPAPAIGWTVPAVYGTCVRAERLVGRCTVRGCRHRVAVDAVVFRVANGSGAWESRYLASGDAGAPWVPEGFSFGRELTPSPRSVLVREVFDRLGLFCPEHAGRVRLRTLTARAVAAVRCSDACRTAVSALCECECGGARHGRAWQR